MSETKLMHGDCLEVMRGMADESVTAIVTDPPYALEFMGKGWDKVLPDVEVWSECLRVLKPGGVLLCFGGTRTFHRLTCSIEDAGFQVRDCLCWLYGSGFPKSLDVSKALDKAAGAKREFVRYKPSDRPNRVGRLGGSLRGAETRAIETATDDARRWDGYGTALKPAWEPIVLAMKPTDGTFAANALEHGVAGINVDECRVETSDSYSYPNGPGGKSHHYSSDKRSAEVRPNPTQSHTKGRWPANVVHDGSDEVEGRFPDAPGQQGDLNPTGRDRPGHGPLGRMGPPAEHAAREDTSKSASRFFYCAKAGKKDRGLSNNHPTVKPLALMRWLVRMVKMPADTVVLDPFMGSGSTGLACKDEDVHFVGIERDLSYVRIARERILLGDLLS